MPACRLWRVILNSSERIDFCFLRFSNTPPTSRSLSWRMIASWWDPPGWRWRPKGIDYPFALRRRHFDRWPRFVSVQFLSYILNSLIIPMLRHPPLFRLRLQWTQPCVTLSRLLVCLCGSDTPPRLCRVAVFYCKRTFSHPIVAVGSQHPRSCWLWGADAKELPLMLRRWHDWHRTSRMQGL